MQQIYETIFILQPELTEEEMESTVGLFEELLKEQKADLHKTEKWGKKRLAYRVKKFWEGFYVYLEYTSSSDVVNELERRLRIHDNVIKWMSVRKDPRAAAEEERRAARMAKAAAQRAEASGEESPSSGNARREAAGQSGPDAREAASAGGARAKDDPSRDQAEQEAGQEDNTVHEPADTAAEKEETTS